MSEPVDLLQMIRKSLELLLLLFWSFQGPLESFRR